MNQHVVSTPTAGGERSKLEPSPLRRAKTSNNPCSGRTNGNSRQGRRIRDLTRSYLRQMGNPAEASRQADALAAAELKVAAEDQRMRVNGAGSLADLEHVIRLENAADRAVRKLDLRPGLPGTPDPTGQRTSLQQHLERLAREQAAGAADDEGAA